MVAEAGLAHGASRIGPEAAQQCRAALTLMPPADRQELSASDKLGKTGQAWVCWCLSAEVTCPLLSLLLAPSALEGIGQGSSISKHLLCFWCHEASNCVSSGAQCHPVLLAVQPWVCSNAHLDRGHFS